MDFAISTLLFIGKWVLIALIYLMLFLVLLAVREEMGQRLASPEPPTSAIPGRLRVLQGGSDPALTNGHIINLPPSIVLGGDRKQLGKADLVIRDRYVSGRHAELSWDGVNWWLNDLDSANGSRINGRFAAPNEKIYVPVGATLQFGDVVFELLA
jgi:hypothetical protein